MTKAQKYAALTIKGHRDLADEEIALINSIKTHGDALEGQCGYLYECASKGTPAIDIRWLEAGRRHLQQGLMELCRAVAKPNGF